MGSGASRDRVPVRLGGSRRRGVAGRTPDPPTRKKGAASPRQRPLDHAMRVVEVSPSGFVNEFHARVYSRDQYLTCRVTWRRVWVGRALSSQDARSTSRRTVLLLPRW